MNLRSNSAPPHWVDYEALQTLMARAVSAEYEILAVPRRSAWTGDFHCTSTNAMRSTPLQARTRLPSCVAIILRTTPPPEGVHRSGRRGGDGIGRDLHLSGRALPSPSLGWVNGIGIGHAPCSGRRAEDVTATLNPAHHGLGCPGGSNVCQGTSLRQTLASQGCRSRGTPSGR